jgi:hypothetical protein
VCVFVVPFSVCDGTGSKKERNTYLSYNILQREIVEKPEGKRPSGRSRL